MSSKSTNRMNLGLVLFLCAGLITSAVLPQWAWANGPMCSGIFVDAFAPKTSIKSSLLSKEIKPALEQSSSEVSSAAELVADFKLHSSSSAQERYQALQKFPLQALSVAPGHNILREPHKISSLEQYIQNNHGGDFQHDKVLLNIITTSSGKIVNVDIWNAHHRLLAFKNLNYKNLGEIKFENIEILVNGVTSWGEKWNHFLPAAGLDFAQVTQYRRVQPGNGVQPNTVEVGGELSNYKLGSKTTLGDLKIPEKKPKVGIYFGTFDPIHEGHVLAAKKLAKEFNLDEVVFFPNINPLHKPNASSAKDRLAMVDLRLQKEKNMNLYVGDSDLILRDFGKDQLIEQVRQVYATDQVFELLGDDSYQTLLNLNQMSAQSNRKFIISPRSEKTEIQVPGHLQGTVMVSQQVDPNSLSSTKVRNKIQSGQTPSPQEMDPDVLKYIREHHLYSSDLKQAG